MYIAFGTLVFFAVYALLTYGVHNKTHVVVIVLIITAFATLFGGSDLAIRQQNARFFLQGSLIAALLAIALVLLIPSKR